MSMRMLLVAVALVAIGIVLMIVLPSPTRFPYAVAAVSADEAVLLTRRNEDTTFSWAQLVNVAGETLWDREVTPLETAESLGYTGVAADAERVVLFGTSDAHQVVAALARMDGEPLWQTTIGPGGSNVIGPNLIMDGERVYVVHELHSDGPYRESITALALADGRVLWAGPVEGAAHLKVALMAPGRLLTSDDDGLVELDGVTGKVARRAHERVLCEVPAGVVVQTDDGLAVWARDGKPRAIALQPRVTGHLCGMYAGDLVMSLGNDDFELVRVDIASGAERWRAKLPGYVSEGVRSMDGRWARFVPLLMRAPPGQPGEVMVVVDLDSGTLSKPLSTEYDFVPIVTAERSYLLQRFHRLLHAIDPSTGSLVSTVRQLNNLWTEEWQPEDFRFGRLWLIGQGWSRPSAMGYAVIDLDTSKVLHEQGQIIVRDVPR